MLHSLIHRLKYCQQALLPPSCILCGSKAEERDLCQACEQDIPRIAQACTRCALPLPTHTPVNQLCGKCLQEPPVFNKVYALFPYQKPIDNLITRLKFQGNLVYAKVLGELMANYLQVEYKEKRLPEYLIPVPLHRKRLRERGFNQAVELARPIVKRLDIPLMLKSCQRVKATVAQINLPAADRRTNLRNAFNVTSTITAKHVAIIDDVVTTGSTIVELSRSLQAVGVERIDIWCCARTNNLEG